jgi:hypothetical protein
MKAKESSLQDEILKIQDSLVTPSDEEAKNIYQDFSRAVDAYILDKSNVDKVSAQAKKDAGVNYEALFKKL